MMSLDNFFATPGQSKKREMAKRGGKAKASSSDTVASHGAENEPMGEAEDETGVQREIDIVGRVTENISKMLDDKLAGVIKPMNELTEKFDTLIERVEAVEQRVSDLEDVTAANDPRICALETQLKKAMERLDSFENQSRRQNVRIIGLKEGAEGDAPVKFFERWIPEVLGLEETVMIDRAHRTGPPVKFAGKEGPRAVLLRMHYYTDTRKILQAARIKGNVSTPAGKVSFYQDFSAEVVKKRRESATARRTLREAGVKYAFLYPATIKIFNPDGTNHSLRTAEEIKKYVDKLQGTS